MKVALVYPEVYDLARFGEKRKEFPPFGILYLAAVLEQNNYEVVIFKVNQDNMSINFQGFDLVGISIPSSATFSMVKEMRFNSSYSKSATIVSGGVHASFYPEATLKELQTDAVAIGCGEKTILEIVKAHGSKNFSHINGIAYLSGQTVVYTPKRVIEDSIDWLPLPARHLLDESDFIMSDRLANTNLRMTHIMLSRGCPFSCRFCAVMQKRIQYRSSANIRVELEHLKQKYRIEGFAVVDDNFVVNKKMVREACAAITGLGLSWSALSRIDTVDYELLQVMHDAGCIELKFGVESGSEKMLEAMGKNISRNQIRRTITLAYAVGIMVKIFLVHGFPGENLASTKETISLLRDIRHMVNRVSLFRFVPLPGSYVFENPDLFDLKVPKNISDWGKFHIYHNNYHWWGNKKQFQEMELAYQELLTFVNDHWS
jgi:anaerobic magnesium-protoporphyrin IX monomethyl ester cyclase